MPSTTASLSRLFALFVLTCGTFTSCYSASNKVTRGEIFDPIEPQPRSVPVEVLVPADGEYAGKAYPGSGKAVALRIQQTAATRFGDVKLVESTGVTGAKSRLRIQAVLQQWEDRNTTWSGKADEIQVQLSLHDATRVRRTLTYYAHSSWRSFVNTPPEDLLNSDFDAAVLELLPDSR
ncbi:MAG TPA: DUF4823 domain-containing protein [Planctomycetota bacterium]